MATIAAGSEFRPRMAAGTVANDRVEARVLETELRAWRCRGDGERVFIVAGVEWRRGAG